jgi:hypothetical protein
MQHDRVLSVVHELGGGVWLVWAYDVVVDVGAQGGATITIWVRSGPWFLPLC